MGPETAIPLSEDSVTATASLSVEQEEEEGPGGSGPLIGWPSPGVRVRLQGKVTGGNGSNEV